MNAASADRTTSASAASAPASAASYGQPIRVQAAAAAPGSPPACSRYGWVANSGSASSSPCRHIQNPSSPAAHAFRLPAASSYASRSTSTGSA